MPIGPSCTTAAAMTDGAATRLAYEPPVATEWQQTSVYTESRPVPVLAWSPQSGPFVESPCCPGTMHRVSRSMLNTMIECTATTQTAPPERCCGHFKLVEQRPAVAPASRSQPKRHPPGKRKCFKRRTACRHGKLINSCARCNPNFRRAPSRKCPCGKDKRFCATHGGQNLCKCGKTKQSCMTCKDPRWICCHDGKYQERRNCVVCGGTGVCIHGRRKDRCSAPECVDKQKRLRAHLASMRPGSQLADPGVSRAQFVDSQRDTVVSTQ